MIFDPFKGSKWNDGAKTTKQARTVGSTFFPGSNWKQEERNRKAAEKARIKAEKKAAKKAAKK